MYPQKLIFVRVRKPATKSMSPVFGSGRVFSAGACGRYAFPPQAMRPGCSFPRCACERSRSEGPPLWFSLSRSPARQRIVCADSAGRIGPAVRPATAHCAGRRTALFWRKVTMGCSLISSGSMAGERSGTAGGPNIGGTIWPTAPIWEHKVSIALLFSTPWPAAHFVLPPTVLPGRLLN